MGNAARLLSDEPGQVAPEFQGTVRKARSKALALKAPSLKAHTPAQSLEPAGG